MRVFTISLCFILSVLSQILMAINIDSLSLVDPSLLSSEELNAMFKPLQERQDHCLLATLFYERATRNSDFTNDGQFILDDLEFSGTYAKNYCKDTTFYYNSRLKYAEVLHANNLKREFAVKEALESLDYFKKNNLKNDMIESYHVLALLYEQSSDFDTAQIYIRNAIDLSFELNDTISEIRNRNIGNRFISLLSKPGIVEPGVEIALAVSSSERDFATGCNLHLESDAIDIGLTLVETYLKLDKVEDAKEQINYIETFDIPKLSQEMSLYKLANEAYEKTGDYRTALLYSNLYGQRIQDKHDLEENTKINNRVQKDENRELAEKLKSANEGLTNARKKIEDRRRWIILLTIATLASLLAIYYIVRFYNQKIRVSDLISNQREEINKQRIVKLENNMRIQSLSSMVSGQEAERNRIANDLHDSLGGTLSALKLQFENVVLEKHADDIPFQNISKLIDGACSEVREIARNLKPASLENIGLEAAIRDLINKYNINSDVEMTFHTYVGNLTLDYDKKLNMYRIIQELLNNVMKHADAAEVDVQLTQAKNELIIKVEDDGKGFNINWVKKGLGLDSIQSRVNVLKGDLNIDTAPSRGTSVIIHIPIQDQKVA